VAQDFADQLSKFEPLRGDGSLSMSARKLMAAMLADGVPTLERLAFAAGVSQRTFQRRLSAERSTFSELLEEVRREIALAGLATGGQKAGDVARTIGYQKKSSFETLLIQVNDG
jgi:AraC-like DNA-binding protein